MSALCCRAGDSPLVAASRVTLSVQLYAELGALGLVGGDLDGEGRVLGEDERGGLGGRGVGGEVARIAGGGLIARVHGGRGAGPEQRREDRQEGEASHGPPLQQAPCPAENQMISEREGV